VKSAIEMFISYALQLFSIKAKILFQCWRFIIFGQNNSITVCKLKAVFGDKFHNSVTALGTIWTINLLCIMCHITFNNLCSISCFPFATAIEPMLSFSAGLHTPSNNTLKRYCSSLLEQMFIILVVYSRGRQPTARGPYAAHSVVSSGPPTRHWQ
jgi:hypothetical protein